MSKVVYASNGGSVGDGMRITRVSENGTKFEILVDPSEERFSEVVLRAEDNTPPAEEPSDPPIEEPEEPPAEEPEEPPAEEPEEPSDPPTQPSASGRAPADFSFADPVTNKVIDLNGARVSSDAIPWDVSIDGTEIRNGTFTDPFHKIIHHADGVAFKNITFEQGFQLFECKNMLFEDTVCVNGQSIINDYNETGNRNIRFRRAKFLDIRQNPPQDWSDPFPRRMTGLYLFGINGLHFDSCLFDYIGWEEGYDPTLQDQNRGQPPSMFSHCLYVQTGCYNAGVECSVFSRGASTGMQFRCGGTVRDCIFVGNNIGFNCADNDEYSPHFASLVGGNIVAHAGRKVAEMVGGVGWSFDSDMPGGTLRQNVLIDAEPSTDHRGAFAHYEPFQDMTGNVDLRSILAPSNLRADHMAAWRAARDAVTSAGGRL